MRYLKDIDDVRKSLQSIQARVVSTAPDLRS